MRTRGMAEVKTAPGTPLRLNHVEFAHRPGERHLVIALIEALGCGWYEVDAPPYGDYLVIRLDGSAHGQNDMFASQAEPEQVALEAALEISVADDPALQDFRALQRGRPYRAAHIGLRLSSVAALDAAVGRLRTLAEGALAGRLHLGEVMTCNVAEAKATDAPLKQLWIGTDVISTGLLTFGQQIELQAYDV
jgi:hypothetical protein